MNHIKPFMWRKGVTLSATFLFSLFLIVACKKKENLIGQNTIDQNELLVSGGIDTFTLFTSSYHPDSIISDNAAFGILGSYVDPVFGTYNSEIYTQFRLSGLNPDFGLIKAIDIDSFVLALEYVGSYGDAGIQTVEVHQLTEDLSIDSTYYSFTTKTVDETYGSNFGDLVEPGKNDVYMDPYAMSVVGGDTLNSPQLRIRLNKFKAIDMLEDASSGNGYFTDNDAFLDYFKGLRIRTKNTGQMSGEGGAFYFNLNDPASKLTIYYTQDGEHKEFDFLINSSCADFNHVDVDTLGQIPMTDSIAGLSTFYAQSFGMRGIVKIPGLSDIPKNAVVHKAIIELPVEYHTSTKYTPGFDISVATILEEGASQLFSVNTIGVYADYRKSFQVDIRNYVQAIVNDELENTRLIFSPTLHNTSAERIIFNGAQSLNKAQPKLYILYTEF
jgi:hypothetical protein